MNCIGKYTELCDSLTGRKRLILFWLRYSFLFLVLTVFVFYHFQNADKSFVWRIDGPKQHFARLEYISYTLRNGLQALLNGEGWTIPLYDFSAGLVRQDLQIGFPQILAILWPWDEIDRFYQFYVLMIYYLVGLSFSAFGLFFEQKPVPIMTGAFTYTFCAYALFAGVRHPHFVVPMIYLPLLLIGAEKLLRKENGQLLTAMVFLSVTTQWGLYFSCMQAIFVVLFIVVRFFDYYEKNRPKEFARVLGRLCLWGGTGVLLSGFVAVPSLLSLLGIGRIGNTATFSNLLYYAKSYYTKFLIYFGVAPASPGGWTYLGFAAISVPSLILLFLRHEKQERSMRVLFLALTIMLLVPAGGYVMSGFSNVSNRFCFAYAMCVSAITMFMIPHFPESTRERITAVIGLGATYVALCILLSNKNKNSDIIFSCLLLTLVILSCCCVAGTNGWRLFPRICLAVTIFSVICSAYLLYSPRRGNYINEFREKPYETIEQEPYNSLSQSSPVKKDDGFYRVAASVNGSTVQDDANLSFLYGFKGISMYPYFGWSTAYFDWISEMELPRNGNKHMILGLDTHSIMLSLANVKYYAARERNGLVIPFGFTQVDAVKNHKNTDLILENDNALPIGYTYDHYISRGNYEKLGALAKQDAQIQTVVLDEAPVRVAEGVPDSQAFCVPFRISSIDGLTWNGGELNVNKENAVLALSFQGEPDMETYLRIVDLDLPDHVESTELTVGVTADVASAKAKFFADSYVYAHMQHTQMIDLGRDMDGFTHVYILFPSKGNFKLANLEIWCQPLENYPAQIAALREESLENVETDWRSLRGTISVSKDKFLCVAIPYMDGWRAYVDGKEVKLYQANTAFMGVELPAGEHVVELRYWLPGLTVGLALSSAGLVSLIVLIALQRKQKCTQRKE